MIRIGIVDDDMDSRKRLKQEIEEYAAENILKYELQEYESAHAFLDGGEQGFDMLFLDIDMPGMSGMELAEKIRETDHEVVIIFCTNLQQFAINGYTVGALGFMVKPVQTYILNLTMDRALTAIQKNLSRHKKEADTTFVLKDGTISRIVNASNIDYVEVRQHYLLYNVKDSTTGARIVIKNRGTMQDAVERLSPYGFWRCSSSFLVNIKSVTAVSRMNVYIGEELLPIGRTFKESFMDAFSRYLAKKGWEDPCQ
ncbi:LytR/AlgR family response regulator transcription factor [Butyrivibrio sp. YAB3001]|uniref:LytR/AlgR family response regulator transcription factor n=1 Tax=Butyrivibrio sp. YAB3001 TaxID=1520812 RepID=UPI0008F6332E|nr:LytTR family DNA-binding domain-containing protein [Butyrivibrio sp. YAB3001]SFD03580.1 two component transcriptional regulator, LytTR family [Butyrivibrio sp. YAB3001]